MLNGRQDQGNNMLIQSFLSADRPSVILKKMSNGDTRAIRLLDNQAVLSKLWITMHQHYHSDLFFSQLNTGSAFLPQYLSFLFFSPSLLVPYQLDFN